LSFFWNFIIFFVLLSDESVSDIDDLFLARVRIHIRLSNDNWKTAGGKE
jgi:hypothetical protein